MLIPIQFLFKDLDSLVNSLGPLYVKFHDICKKFAEDSERSQKTDILTQQRDSVESSWKSVQESSRERKRKLDKIKLPSESYHDQETVFVEWLDGAETKLKKLDSVPSDLQEAKKLVAELKVICL